MVSRLCCCALFARCERANDGLLMVGVVMMCLLVWCERVVYASVSGSGRLVGFGWVGGYRWYTAAIRRAAALLSNTKTAY